MRHESNAPTNGGTNPDALSWPAAQRRMEGVEGLITEAQTRRLFQRARGVPDGGRIVEIGSFRGRSTIALALGAPGRTEIVAIDPYLPSKDGAPIDEGEAARESFFANLDACGVADRVRQVRQRSSEAVAQVDGEIDLLWIDGDHGYRAVRDDVDIWAARVPPGGTMLLHDAWSSVLVTGAILRTVSFNPRWRYQGREGSMVEYRRVADRDGLPRSVAKQLAELPWFFRNVLIKAAQIAHVPVVARLLGHRSDLPPF